MEKINKYVRCYILSKSVSLKNFFWHFRIISFISKLKYGYHKREWIIIICRPSRHTPDVLMLAVDCFTQKWLFFFFLILLSGKLISKKNKHKLIKVSTRLIKKVNLLILMIMRVAYDLHGSLLIAGYYLQGWGKLRSMYRKKFRLTNIVCNFS